MLATSMTPEMCETALYLRGTANTQLEHWEARDNIALQSWPHGGTGGGSCAWLHPDHCVCMKLLSPQRVYADWQHSTCENTASLIALTTSADADVP